VLDLKLSRWKSRIPPAWREQINEPAGGLLGERACFVTSTDQVLVGEISDGAAGWLPDLAKR